MFNRETNVKTTTNALLRTNFISLADRSVTLPLLAHTFVPAVRRMVPGTQKYCLWLCGPTATGKTNLSAAACAFWYDDPLESMVHARLPKHKIAAEARQREGKLFVLDDAKQMPQAKLEALMIPLRVGRVISASHVMTDTLLVNSEDALQYRAMVPCTLHIVTNFDKDAVPTSPLVKEAASVFKACMDDVLIQLETLNTESNREELFNKFLAYKKQFPYWDSAEEIQIAENAALNRLGWDMASAYFDLYDLQDEYVKAMRGHFAATVALLTNKKRVGA